MEFSIIIPKSEFGFSLGGLADVQQSVRSRFRSRFFPTGVAWSEATLVRVLCGIRAGPVRVLCGIRAGFVQGVQQSVRGVQQGAGNRIDFSIFDFSESPRGLSALQKFPNGLFISIHFP